MPEFSGEFVQSKPESPQIDKARRQKLDNISGGEIVDPSVLGITPEKARNIYDQFEHRVRAETDIDKLVDGILPPEALFNPNFPLTSIETSEGPVEIKRVGRVRRAVVNTLERFANLQEYRAKYNPIKRKITIVPELDTFSTVVAAAKRKFENISGFSLVHEAVHAHQFNMRKRTLGNLVAITREAVRINKEVDPELSAGEAAQLLVKSRDANILLESQAYLLQYSLTGIGFNESPFSRYTENGFVPIVDLVEDKVKDYLPQKDQYSEEYRNRIQAASCQIIRLLDQGANHRQIADLIRNNYDSINAGNEWDEETKKYNFLQHAIEEHPNQDQIDDETLLKKFDNQKDQRYEDKSNCDRGANQKIKM